jgi:AcrR family transcriptional regulator
LLQEALQTLLRQKPFEEISIQDITAAATLNRATFYAHYSDKFALLEELIRVNFLQFLQKRNVSFDGSCSSAFRVIVFSVCDYLVEVRGMISSSQHQLEPFVQAKIIDQIRLVLLDGFKVHPVERRISPEAIAAAASWAIYGAAKQWIDSAEPIEQEKFVDQAVEMVQPILLAGQQATPGQLSAA